MSIPRIEDSRGATNTALYREIFDSEIGTVLRIDWFRKMLLCHDCFEVCLKEKTFNWLVPRCTEVRALTLDVRATLILPK